MDAATNLLTNSNNNIETTTFNTEFRNFSKQSITFSLDSKKLYSVIITNYATINVAAWNLDSKQKSQEFSADISIQLTTIYGAGLYVIQSASISPDGKTIAFILNSNIAGVFFLETTSGKCTHIPSLVPAIAVEFSSLDPKIIFIRYQDSLTFWNIEQRSKIGEFNFTNEMGPFAISPDTKQIAWAGYEVFPKDCGHPEYLINIWDVDILHRVCNIPTEQRRIRNLAISPDGKRIAACMEGEGVTLTKRHKHVRLWNMDSKKCIHKFAYISMPKYITFSPDGTRIAVVLNDETIVVHTDQLASKALAFGNFTKTQILALAMAQQWRVGAKSPAKTLTELNLRQICNMCMVTPWKEVFE